jgi:hypothetical protein
MFLRIGYLSRAYDANGNISGDPIEYESRLKARSSPISSLKYENEFGYFNTYFKVFFLIIKGSQTLIKFTSVSSIEFCSYQWYKLNAGPCPVNNV